MCFAAWGFKSPLRHQKRGVKNGWVARDAFETELRFPEKVKTDAFKRLSAGFRELHNLNPSSCFLKKANFSVEPSASKLFAIKDVGILLRFLLFFLKIRVFLCVAIPAINRLPDIGCCFMRSPSDAVFVADAPTSHGCSSLQNFVRKRSFGCFDASACR